MQVTPRQGFILRKVVEGHVASCSRWAPVGRRPGRHPLGPVHDQGGASAAGGGRPARAPAHVRGPRSHRQRLPLLRGRAAGRGPAPVPRGVALTDMRREVDEAMATTEQLSQVTNLLALGSAPPIETSTIRRVEGAPPPAAGADDRGHHVHGRGYEAGDPVRRSSRSWPVAWAGSYPNEVLGGMDVRPDARPGSCPTRDWTRPSAPSSPRWRRSSPSSRTPPATPCSSTAPRGCCPSTASRSCLSSAT